MREEVSGITFFDGASNINDPAGSMTDKCIQGYRQKSEY
jgi:hypothetical protein